MTPPVPAVVEVPAIDLGLDQGPERLTFARVEDVPAGPDILSGETRSVLLRNGQSHGASGIRHQ